MLIYNAVKLRNNVSDDFFLIFYFNLYQHLHKHKKKLLYFTNTLQYIVLQS